MAKWGEGDPRWIVEERPDGTNVHNWHWTEKVATAWSKSLLTDLLKSVVIEEGPIQIWVSEISKLDGEATANNRKAKLIFLYEWDIVLTWKAKVAGSEADYEGKIEIPNLSDENEANEVEVNPTITKGDSDLHAEAIRHSLLTKGTLIIHEHLGSYISKLKEEYSRGLILPTKGEGVTAPNVTGGKDSARVVNKKEFQSKIITNSDLVTNGKSAVQLSESELTTLTLKREFVTSPDKLFEAFIDPELVRAWTRSAVKMEAGEKGSFSLFGGMVEGQFTEMEQNELIRMKWRLRSYPTGHYAEVSLKFEDRSDRTELRVKVGNVPKLNYEETQQGWERHYFQNILRTFGYGAQLF